MNRVLLIFTAFVAFLPQGFGCINHYVPNARALKAGEDAYTRITSPNFVRSWETVREELAAKLEKSRDVKTLNDLAVAMIHTGATAEAIPLLEEIERTRPGLYQTATNLGTAYELLGKPKEALAWIERGIAINPDSHGGSEWIHVAVLKAKLALEKDPQWLEKNRVLGMDFGDNLHPRVPDVFPTGNRGEPLNVAEVHVALERQLRERLQFVSPPDEIVSQLISDYANLTVIKDKQRALAAGGPLYRLARDYATTAASAKAIAKRLPKDPRTTQEKRWIWGLSLVLLTLVLLGSCRNVQQAAKKQRSGAMDERFVSFPPLASVLMGILAFMWIGLSDDLSMPAFTVSMMLLAMACAGVVVLARAGERYKRQTGKDVGFSSWAFTVSSGIFAVTWIIVTYLSVE